MLLHSAVLLALSWYRVGLAEMRTSKSCWVPLLPHLLWPTRPSAAGHSSVCSDHTSFCCGAQLRSCSSSHVHGAQPCLLWQSLEGGLRVTAQDEFARPAPDEQPQGGKKGSQRGDKGWGLAAEHTLESVSEPLAVVAGRGSPGCFPAWPARRWWQHHRLSRLSSSSPADWGGGLAAHVQRSFQCFPYPFVLYWWEVWNQVSIEEEPLLFHE